MKNAQSILSEIYNQHNWQPLKQHNCYHKFLKLLTKRLKDAIAFIYIKNDTLFVAVKHHGLKMEIDCNKDLLKSLLTSFSELNPDCKISPVKKVVAFHTKYHNPPTIDHQTAPFYTELAQGDFQLQFSNPELLEIFEKIKQAIKCNQ